MRGKPKPKPKPKLKPRPELRLKIEYVDPKTLTLWDENPRRNDAAARKLVGIIEQHGFGVPVTVREEDDVVYKGNTRVKTALLLGMDAVPVMRRSYPKLQDAIDDAIADNKMQDEASWNEDMLAKMFQERKELSAEQLAAQTGFEAAEITGLREGWVPSVDPKTNENGKTSRGKFAAKCPHCGHEGPVRCGACKKEFSL